MIGKLLSEFKVSQGPLFHYTPQAASAGIGGGEVWMSRADCFVDSEEIDHGLKVLSDVAGTTLTGSEIKSFSGVLNALRERLQSCYVMSFSQDPDNEYLKSNYAGDGGAVLEFEENFPHVLHGGWHAVANSDDSFSLRYVVDAYDFFEGFVVYDVSHQQRLATMACFAYRDCVSADTHIVDIYQFVNILLQCLVLFKARKFEEEEEYRVALVRMQGLTDSFEETRDRAGCSHVYIKVRMPTPEVEKIQTRNL